MRPRYNTNRKDTHNRLGAHVHTSEAGEPGEKLLIGRTRKNSTHTDWHQTSQLKVLLVFSEPHTDAHTRTHTRAHVSICAAIKQALYVKAVSLPGVALLKLHLVDFLAQRDSSFLRNFNSVTPERPLKGNLKKIKKNKEIQSREIEKRLRALTAKMMVIRARRRHLALASTSTEGCGSAETQADAGRRVAHHSFPLVYSILGIRSLDAGSTTTTEHPNIVGRQHSWHRACNMFPCRRPVVFSHASPSTPRRPAQQRPCVSAHAAELRCSSEPLPPPPPTGASLKESPPRNSHTRCYLHILSCKRRRRHVDANYP